MKLISFQSRKLRRRTRHSTARRGGQGMIESALVIGALLVLSMGMVQYGMIYNAILTLNNMAREGARYAAVRATETNIKGSLVTYLKNRATGTTVSPDLITNSSVTLSVPTTATPNNKTVRVSIVYDMKANKQFLPGIVPLPDSWRTYRATAANVLEGPAPSVTPAP